MKKERIPKTENLTSSESILSWSKTQKKKVIVNIVKLLVVLLAIISFNILGRYF